MEGCALIFMILVCIIVVIIGVCGGVLVGLLSCIGQLLSSIDPWFWVTLAILALIIGIIVAVNS